MLRKETVLESLKNYTKSIDLETIRNGYNGATTNELVAILNIDRSNCSRELNNLFNEGLVLKVIGKPVRYFPIEHLETLIHAKILLNETPSLREAVEASISKLSDFDTIIGANGSLRMAIDQAKAAMIYPPFGLHTLITGETGIGKTMFVELMYRYAKEFGVLGNNAELIVFNCAEYADNPQLLVSELFGYVKGAFTGAESNRDGLVAKANKGILFLDEIHRLPPEGQEMLFQLMDSGKYRRLGESSQWWRADVLIIGATTESLESSLLLTFMRRIPMLIALPNLENRPLKERLDLIHLFFNTEQKKIKKNILVDKKVIYDLLSHKYPGNIGQLKTDIQLICARTFLDAMTRNMSELRITPKVLPQYLLGNSSRSPQQSIAIDTLLNAYPDKIIYDGRVLSPSSSFETDFYDNIHDSMEIDEIKSYIQKMILSSYETRASSQSPEEILKIIKPEIYYSVEAALDIAQSRLKCSFSHQTYIAFALHIQSIIERGLEARILYNVSEDIKIQYPEEYQASKLVMSYLSDELVYEFAQEEELLTTLFLATHYQKEEEHIGLLVIAHGNGVAKSVANVANTLLVTDHAVSMDMGLDEDVEVFYERFEQRAQQVNQGKGVLILADMGSLLNFGTRFSKATGIPSETIGFLSTPLVLESLRKVLFSNLTLSLIQAELMDTIKSLVNERPLAETLIPTSQKKLLIVTCMTGEGAAIALKNYIQDSLPSISHMNLKIITSNKDNFNQDEIKDAYVCAVVGALDLKLEQVPYISTEELLLGNGLKTLEFLLGKNSGHQEMMSSQRWETMLRILKDTLSFLNPEKTLQLVKDSFEEISTNYEVDEYERLNINFSLHVPNMIERIMRHEALPYQDIEARISQNEKLYKVLRSALQDIEETYRVIIPDTEIAYIMDMFDTY